MTGAWQMWCPSTGRAVRRMRHPQACQPDLGGCGIVNIVKWHVQGNTLILAFKWICPSIFRLFSVALDSYWSPSNWHTIFWLNIEIIWLNFWAFFPCSLLWQAIRLLFNDSSALVNKQHQQGKELSSESSKWTDTTKFYKCNFFLPLWPLCLIFYVYSLYLFPWLGGKDAVEIYTHTYDNVK